MPYTDHILAAGTSPLLASATGGGGVTGLVATGSTANDALQLSASWNAITTSSSNTGVKLPAVAGGFGGIRNDSGNNIIVYPPTGATLNAAASSLTLATAKTLFYFWTSPTTIATVLTA